MKMTTVLPSKIHGSGLFSLVDMPAGLHIPIPYTDEPQFDGHDAFDGERYPGGGFQYLNHCVSPNCEVLWEEDRLYLVLLQDLGRWDELTIDYGPEYWEQPEECANYAEV